MKTNIHFLTYFVISRSVLFRMRNVSGKICRENQNHILYSTHFFENLTFCEIMWKNIVETDRPPMTIWRMRISRWIAKVTNTQSEYGTLLLIHGNSGRTNAPLYHVTRTFPVLFPVVTGTETIKRAHWVYIITSDKEKELAFLNLLHIDRIYFTLKLCFCLLTFL